MAAHPLSSAVQAADAHGIDPGGIERGIARRMPSLMLGAVAVLVLLWWMAAQPPAGPGWGYPQNPQYPQYPQQGQGPRPGPPTPPPPPPSSGCTLCSGLECGDCLSGLDCSGIDCSGIDCSGIDCSGIDCAVSRRPTATKVKSCSTDPWRRLAGSSGLLFPLFVMIAWRRRLRR